MTTEFLLKLDLGIEFHIAITWNAIKRYFRPAYEVLKSIIRN